MEFLSLVDRILKTTSNSGHFRRSLVFYNKFQGIAQSEDITEVSIYGRTYSSVNTQRPLIRSWCQKDINLCRNELSHPPRYFSILSRVLYRMYSDIYDASCPMPLSSLNSPCSYESIPCMHDSICYYWTQNKVPKQPERLSKSSSNPPHHPRSTDAWQVNNGYQFERLHYDGTGSGLVGTSQTAAMAVRLSETM